MQVQQLIKTQQLLKVSLGVILLAAFSQVSIPLEPVPVTLQTVAVMLIGLTYAPSQAIQTVLAYLALGAVGVPVFANFSAGAAVLLGKTGGYLWGFVFAVFLMSFLQQKKLIASKWLQDSLLCTVGTAVIFITGVSYLAGFIGFDAAITYGFWPFVLPGIAKIMLLVAARRALS